MKVIIFEGTPEEYLKVAHTFGRPSSSAEGGIEQHQAVSESEPLTIDEARYFLTRRELSFNVTRMLNAIYHAGPDGITEDDLLAELEMHGQAFGGMLGSFSRRFVTTFWKRDLNLYRDFLVRDVLHGVWRYWLTDIARDALVAEGVIESPEESEVA